MRLADKLCLAYRLGYFSEVSQILLELDEWADSVGAGFLLVQQSEYLAELWLYGSYKAQWSFVAGREQQDAELHATGRRTT